MSILANLLEKIIDRIVDLESFENRMNIMTKLDMSKNKTHRIRSGLDGLEIMEMNTKTRTEK